MRNIGSPRGKEADDAIERAHNGLAGLPIVPRCV
jgi:hypothetical protein